MHYFLGVNVLYLVHTVTPRASADELFVFVVILVPALNVHLYLMICECSEWWYN